MKTHSPEKDLEKIRNQVAGCKKCPLHQERIHAVFGEGPWDAPIMVIGEGPGANEDKQGLPFVGRAGKLLDQLLEQQGLSRRENVFIANIVKCRPPKNRVPKKPEVEACFPYLTRQIQLINPSIILLLGATAIKSYRGELKEKISDVRGKWSREDGRLVMATFHPAAVFRNRTYQGYIEEDLKTIADQYRKELD
jgi:DNA polymerase